MYRAAGARRSYMRTTDQGVLDNILLSRTPWTDGYFGRSHPVIRRYHDRAAVPSRLMVFQISSTQIFCLEDVSSTSDGHMAIRWGFHFQLGFLLVFYSWLTTTRKASIWFCLSVCLSVPWHILKLTHHGAAYVAASVRSSRLFDSRI